MDTDTVTIVGLIIAIISVVAAIFQVKYAKESKEFQEKNSILPIQEIRVERLLDPDDDRQQSDLDEVFEEIYRERFKKEEERDSTNDIVRWLREFKKDPKGNIVEYFLIAKSYIGETKAEVCGLLYATCYPNNKPPFGLISYLAVKENTPRGNSYKASLPLIKTLRDYITKEIKDCQGLLIEVEDPNTPDFTLTEKKEAKSRIRLFKRHARYLDVPFMDINCISYLQPHLEIEKIKAKEREMPLCLIYLPINKTASLNKITKRQTNEFLGFLYDKIYGDCFLDNPVADKLYRHYLKELKKRVLDTYKKNAELESDIKLK